MPVSTRHSEGSLVVLGDSVAQQEADVGNDGAAAATDSMNSVLASHEELNFDPNLIPAPETSSSSLSAAAGCGQSEVLLLAANANNADGTAAAAASNLVANSSVAALPIGTMSQVELRAVALNRDEAGLQKVLVDDLRKLCGAIGISKLRGADSKKFKKPYLIELILLKRAALAAEAQAGDVAAAAAGNPAAIVSLQQPPEDKPSLEIRLQNVLFGSLKALTLTMGEKPSKADLDQKRTGANAPVWQQATAAFNELDWKEDLDTLRPRTSDGEHPFWTEGEFRLCPPRRAHEPVEVKALFSALHRRFRDKYAK
eukprot:GHVU01134637.1.p1 GENE.GHVU01134637.1~~GHVU01134637.1.p1  ORF type:complete len:313 (+),score=62.77 GHVU01134637.1:367-1305(+)